MTEPRRKKKWLEPRGSSSSSTSPGQLFLNPEPVNGRHNTASCPSQLRCGSGLCRGEPRTEVQELEGRVDDVHLDKRFVGSAPPKTDYPLGVRATHTCKWFSSCPAAQPPQCLPSSAINQSASCKRLKPDPEHSTHQSRPFVLYKTSPIPHLLHHPEPRNARKMSENYAAPNQQRYLRACMVCSIVMTLAVCTIFSGI